MEINEIKAAAEKNYKVIMAAIKVREAFDSYEAAERVKFDTPFNWENPADNDKWCEALEKRNRAEGNLKKAVNTFFIAVGEKPRKWNLGIDAQYAFNGYLREMGFGSMKKPLQKIELYDCICI